MIIVPGRSHELPTDRRDATFTGTVWADPVLPTTDGVTVNTVFFSPGARTFWHHHEKGQLLQVVAGAGLICSDHGRPHVLRPGDLVWAGPMERHWHGASPNAFMTHFSLSLGVTTWGDEVLETDYTATPDE